MTHLAKWFLYATVGGLVLLTGGVLLGQADPAAAQCGTSASSCKNCHETRGAMPVSSQGEWHTAHAFGDFCEFCHAGNVQAAAQEEAHVGMVAPLEDVQASCQGCHPTDFADRAQKYGAALGIEVGAGGSPALRGGSPSGPASGATSVSAPLGGEEIDFNLLYAEATAAPPLVSNWGNLILALMTLGTASAFLGTVWSWEGWGRTAAAWIDLHVAPIPRAVAAAATRSDGSAPLTQALADQQPGQVQALLDRKPELRSLLPKLMRLSPDTLAALDTILADLDRGSEILTAIGRVDGEVISALRQIGDRDRNLLLALVKGL
jgi:hypothetical protein